VTISFSRRTLLHSGRIFKKIQENMFSGSVQCNICCVINFATVDTYVYTWKCLKTILTIPTLVEILNVI